MEARIALGWLCLNRDSFEARTFEHSADRTCLLFILDVEFAELLTVNNRQTRSEVVIAWRFQKCRNVPVFFTDEAFDLGFAIADQPKRYRLHTASGTGTWQLTPQNRRQGEADQIIERTASQIGVNQGLVNVTRIGDGIQNGFLVIALNATRFTVLPLRAFF